MYYIRFINIDADVYIKETNVNKYIFLHNGYVKPIC